MITTSIVLSFYRMLCFHLCHEWSWSPLSVLLCSILGEETDPSSRCLRVLPSPNSWAFCCFFFYRSCLWILIVDSNLQVCLFFFLSFFFHLLFAFHHYFWCLRQRAPSSVSTPAFNAGRGQKASIGSEMEGFRFCLHSHSRRDSGQNRPYAVHC